MCEFCQAHDEISCFEPKLNFMLTSYNEKLFILIFACFSMWIKAESKQNKRRANLYLDSCSMYEIRKIKKSKNKTKSTNKTIDTWKSKVLYSEKMNTRLIILKRYERMEPRAQSRQLRVEKRRNISMETTGNYSFPDTRIKKAVYILAD